jgi:TBC1 domain family member 14
MWWNGVPPKLRGTVWQRAIGNDLEISETTYARALEKANTEKNSTLCAQHAKITESTATVFPELKMFGRTESGEAQPHHQDLVDICLAYAAYRPDVENLSGIHHIAALFLLQMSPEATFSTLCNLLNRPLPLSFLVRDHTAMTAAYDTTLSALHKKFPALAARLFELRVEPDTYLRGWFESCFCGRLGVELWRAIRFCQGWQWGCWGFWRGSCSGERKRRY